MVAWLRRLMGEPLFEDDEDITRAAGLLNIVLWTLLAVVVVADVAALVVVPAEVRVRRLAFSGLFILWALGCRWLMHRGRVRMIAGLLVGGMYVLVTLILATSGGVRLPFFGAYVILVLITSLSLGERAGFIVAGASILTGLGLVYAESRGVVPGPRITITPAIAWVMDSLTLAFAAVLLHVATRGLRVALERVRHDERALAESNRELRREIVERNRVEESLRTSEEKFSKAFRASPDSIAITTREDGRFIDVNESFLRFAGRPREDVIGRTSLEINLWADPEDRAEFVRIGQEQGAVRDMETAFRKKSGEVRAVLVSSEPIDLRAEPCLISVAKDITERVRAEEEVRRLNEELEQRVAERTAELRESEAKIRAQYDGIPVPTYTWQRAGEDFVLVDYNDAAVAATYGKIASLLGTKASQMYRDEPQILEELSRCFTEKTPIERETLYQYRFFDESRHLAVKYAFVPPDLVLVHTEDITARRRAQEEIERRSAQLEAANRELADFAHIVSHDLKAPLRAISQLADWIAEDYAECLDEGGQQKLRLLIDRAKRMHGLIDVVLEYSRIGRVGEVRRRVDLNQLVGETVEMLALPEHIQVIVEDELPIIVGERTRLGQVFQNLLNNAIKFMDKPEGRVSVGCVDEGDHWVFSVTDNGPGIEERHFARIFKMFQALSPRDEVESTGVGLAVVKKIVETWGGRVWVESTVGQGSTFYFTHLKRGRTHEKR